MKIGIFDSGVGGLSVLEKILRYNLQIDIIYLADKKNCPYGEKTCKELIDIVKENINYLISKGCEIIVIACNTASFIYNMYLKEEFNVKIYNILEFSMEWIATKELDKICVFETSFLQKENRFNKMQQSIGINRPKVFEVSGWDIAKNVESNGNYVKDIERAVKSIPEEIKNVLLSCTHYSLIYNEFEEVKKTLEKDEINFIDPAPEFAKYVLKELKLESFKEADLAKEMNFKLRLEVNKGKKEFNNILKKVMPWIKM